jgi:hypothetical protein
MLSKNEFLPADKSQKFSKEGDVRKMESEK